MLSVRLDRSGLRFRFARLLAQRSLYALFDGKNANKVHGNGLESRARKIIRHHCIRIRGEILRSLRNGGLLFTARRSMCFREIFERKTCVVNGVFARCAVCVCVCALFSLSSSLPLCLPFSVFFSSCRLFRGVDKSAVI